MSIITDNWDVELNLEAIERKSFKEFEVKIKQTNQQIFDLFDNNFTGKKSNVEGNVQSNDDELKSLTEANKQLLLEIESKVEELSKKKTQYEKYKKDQKLLCQGIKEKHEAFLMAKKTYMKFLKIYYTIDSKTDGTWTIFVQFFTDVKKEAKDYSLKLLKHTNTGKYELLSTTPELKNLEDIKIQLKETNNVAGTLCYIRQAFKNLKTETEK